MTRLALTFLGAPQIRLDNTDVAVGRSRALALLAFLAVSQQPASRDSLITLFWPDYDAKQSTAYLRQTLWTINKAIGKEWISNTPNGVELDFGTDIWVDVIEYRRRLRIIDFETTGSARLPGMLEAAKLYRGDFLHGFTIEDSVEFQQWQRVETESLSQLQLTLLSNIVEYLGEKEEFGQAIDYGRRWLAMDMLNEPAHRQLMKLYTWSGQRGQAVRQFQECTQVLSKELGVSPSAATVQLYEAITQNRLAPPTSVPAAQATTIQQLAAPATSDKKPALIVPATVEKPQDAPLTRSAQESKPKLPVSITPFIGREIELEQISSLLAEDSCRLITLVGPGGIGKTRLAVTAAESLATTFGDGVHFVPLADISEVDRLTTVIASVLGFALYRRDDEPLQQLLAYLADKQMLLVLDNFEHLLDGAQLVTTILLAAPNVKVIATSRERLNIDGEWLVEVSGLTYPRQTPTDIPLDRFAVEYSAVELFIRSAQRVNWSFRLETDNQAMVIKICQLVEGMPLALELAASWMRLLSCEEIVAEIQKGISILSTNQRTLPDRHRSMIALFNYSWFLLNDTERDVVQRLSVFRGGFRRDAAQAVAAASLPILLSLADKSLIRSEGDGRFSMHELLRQFAEEKLSANPETVQTVRNQHAIHFTNLLRQHNKDIHGKNQKHILKGILADIENIRFAWRWIVEQQDESAIDSIYEILAAIYELCGWLHEGESIFSEALSQCQSFAADKRDAKRAIEGKLMARLAFFSHRLGKYTQAKEQFQHSYQLLLSANSDYETVYCLNNLGEIFRIEGNYDEASRLLAEAIDLCKLHNFKLRHGRVLNTLAILNGTRGDYTLARQYLDESLRIGESIEDQLGIAKALNNLGILAYFAQDYGTAISYYRRCLAINQEMGHQYDEALALSNIGMAMQKQGDYKNAVKLLRESSDMLKRIGYELGVGLTLVSLSSALLDLGQREESTTHYLEVLYLGRKIHSKPLILAAIAGAASIYEAMGHLEEALTLATIVQAHPATDDEIRTKAADVLQLVRTRNSTLSPAILANRSLDETLDHLVQSLLASGVSPHILSAFSRSLSNTFTTAREVAKVST